MEQIKYIVYSILILVGAALTYTVMEPVLTYRPPSLPQQANKTTSATAQSATVKNVAGKTLFSANCQTCHAVNKDLTGPALANVTSRGPWTERANLVKWVHNPAAFIPTTEYTTGLVAKYNGQVMPSFSQLGESEINQIFDYLDEVSGAGN